MLRVPAPTRVAFGTLQVGKQKIELFVSPEWSRYFETLNAQVQAAGAALAQSAAHTALLDDARDAADGFPAPPGPRGMQGEPGPPLFLLTDDSGETPMPVPPSVDGVYVPLKSVDASDGVPGLTQFRINLKNAAGTITSWFTTAAATARTWTMPDKDGTVAVLGDFAVPPAIGSTAPAAGAFTTLNATTAGFTTLTAASGDFTALSAGDTDVAALTASAGFGCNGAAAQSPAASGGTLAGVIAALVANGILSS